MLDFSCSTEELLRRIRGLNPWPVAEATLLGKRVRIWSAGRVAETYKERTERPGLPGSISRQDEFGLAVSSGDGSLLLTELQWPGKPVQPASIFAQGRNLVGEQFQFAAAAG